MTRTPKGDSVKRRLYPSLLGTPQAKTPSPEQAVTDLELLLENIITKNKMEEKQLPQFEQLMNAAHATTSDSDIKKRYCKIFCDLLHQTTQQLMDTTKDDDSRKITLYTQLATLTMTFIASSKQLLHNPNQETGHPFTDYYQKYKQQQKQVENILKMR